MSCDPPSGQGWGLGQDREWEWEWQWEAKGWLWWSSNFQSWLCCCETIKQVPSFKMIKLCPYHQNVLISGYHFFVIPLPGIHKSTHWIKKLFLKHLFHRHQITLMTGFGCRNTLNGQKLEKLETQHWWMTFILCKETRKSMCCRRDGLKLDLLNWDWDAKPAKKKRKEKERRRRRGKRKSWTLWLILAGSDESAASNGGGGGGRRQRGRCGFHSRWKQLQTSLAHLKKKALNKGNERFSSVGTRTKRLDMNLLFSSSSPKLWNSVTAWDWTPDRQVSNSAYQRPAVSKSKGCGLSPVITSVRTPCASFGFPWVTGIAQTCVFLLLPFLSSANMSAPNFNSKPCSYVCKTSPAAFILRYPCGLCA